jgi:hypothetical protein
VVTVEFGGLTRSSGRDPTSVRQRVEIAIDGEVPSQRPDGRPSRRVARGVHGELVI